MVNSLNPFIAKLPATIDSLVLAGLILLPLVGGLFWTSGVLFGLTFLTAILWIIEKIMRTSYGYKTLFRMGMHGVTWAILFTFLLELTHQTAQPYNMIFLLWMIFVLYKNKVKLLVNEKHI